MEIKTVHILDVDEIITLAKLAWQETYKEIISQEQIEFMLNSFYNKNRLENEIADKKNIFSKAVFENKIIGYTHCILQNEKLKLSKIYLLPHQKNKGIGTFLLNNVKEIAEKNNIHTIILQVNRFNSAKEFYLKNGFKITEEVDEKLDKFILNDYVMEFVL